MAKKFLKNLETTCRICLKVFPSENEMINIFSNSNNKSNTPTFILIMACAAVQIFDWEHLPRRICSKCHHLLTEMCLFRELIEFSDAKLRRLLLENTSKIEKDVELVSNGSNSNVIFESQSCESNPILKVDVAAQSSIDGLSVESAIEYSKDKMSQRFQSDTDGKKNLVSRGFSCSTCSKMCLTVMGLKAHRKSHLKAPLLCSDCGKAFAYKRLLTQHKLTHQNDRLFCCADCGKSFKTKGRLKVHSRGHRNDRPFPCRFCDKRFFQAGHRDQHQGSHTGDRPFACHKCEKRFRSQTGLQGHLRSHDGVLPFQCELCGKQFALKSSLKNHNRLQKLAGTSCSMSVDCC